MDIAPLFVQNLLFCNNGIFTEILQGLETCVCLLHLWKGKKNE